MEQATDSSMNCTSRSTERLTGAASELEICDKVLCLHSPGCCSHVVVTLLVKNWSNHTYRSDFFPPLRAGKKKKKNQNQESMSCRSRLRMILT